MPGFDVSVWFGVVAPAGTPAPVVARLNAEINHALKLSNVVQLFHAQGVEPKGGSAEEFAAFLRIQTAKWAKVVKDSGTKAE